MVINYVVILWFLGTVCRNWEESDQTGPMSKIFPAILHSCEGNYAISQKEYMSSSLGKLHHHCKAFSVQIYRALLEASPPLKQLSLSQWCQYHLRCCWKCPHTTESAPTFHEVPQMMFLHMLMFKKLVYNLESFWSEKQVDWSYLVLR